jgi:hypothetical protein
MSFEKDICVGFGLLMKNILLENFADIGMYTIPIYRNKGYGKLTIQSLINECLRNDLIVIAGCWYYNHNSKKTLESSGMSTKTRLLKIKY